MSSVSYHYFHVDSAGNLQGAEWFDAESDEAAIGAIREKHADVQCEIWEGRRLVASIRPEPLVA